MTETAKSKTARAVDEARSLRFRILRESAQVWTRSQV